MEIRRGKRSVTRRYGFRSSGNINHKRYDHRQRPAIIHVICPRCGYMAIARDLKSGNRVIVNDCQLSWNGKPFELKCTNCKHVEPDLSYFELPEPYHVIPIKGGVLWAYNWQHLDMIYKSLSNQSIKSHPYEFFATYIHGVWMKKASECVKAIKKHIQINDRKHRCASQYFFSKN